MAVVYIIFAYLLGSIPVGIVLAKLKGQDPRKVGSGNIGATNVMRTSGKAIGVLTLAGDIVKGLLPTWLAIEVGEPKLIVAAVGLAAFLGHLFPIYIRFRGGKGVATAVGFFLALEPAAVIISACVFIMVLLLWRYVSAGSLVGTALMPALLLLFSAPIEYVVVSLVVAIFIYYKHRDNIKRLLAGTENRFRSRG
jgi:glycerol-3-phosphate acyltransferase PlsY